MRQPTKSVTPLYLLQDVSLALVQREEPDLTSRQMALLLSVYLDPAPHTVRGLATKLDASKAAITRALDTLGRMDYVRRKRDDADRRNVLVQRTVKGAVFLSEIADIVRLSQEKMASEKPDDKSLELGADVRE